MICVTLMAALAAGGPTVLWLNAYEIEPAGIEVAEGGTYHVWVWAPDDETASLAVGGKKLEAAAKPKPEKKYAWAKAGEADLKPGKIEVVLRPRIAGVALSMLAGFDPAKAQGDMRVFDQPQAVRDVRAETAKCTETVFTMPEFRTREEWDAYAAKLRKRILMSSGLWPLPEHTPLNAKITGRITHEDYTVEKVQFEARPGFLVTGNLYRPVGKGPFPGVANPHGHWKEGRLANEELGSQPGRCITLARMGMVAFSYDMIGYNDSLQFEHKWGGPREKLWGISPFAMQLWSSIRVIDFLQSLPDVDPDRIGCTGESGGGTQTFSLMSVEPRVTVAAPVNMISHSYQGGCLCENAPILRIENSNMEIGALMAPRPLLLISATGDWTRETPRVEYPAIRSIYKLCNAEDKIENVHIDAPHNYNKSSREAMYRFFGQWLLGDRAKWSNFTEPPFTVEKEEDLRVFPDKKLPEGLPKADEILARIIESNRAKWQPVLPKTKHDDAPFRKEYGDCLALVLGVAPPIPIGYSGCGAGGGRFLVTGAYGDDLAPERVGFEERKEKGYVVERWVLHRKCVGDAVPAILYRAYGSAPQDAALIVHGRGKAALANVETGGPGPLVAGLIAQGKAVMTIDTFLIGEHHAPQARTQRKQVGPFMDTFQPTDTGYRIQDVMTALAYLHSRRDLTPNIDLVGLEDGGLWCLFGAALGDNARTTIIDANRFDVDDDKTWADKYYIPCIRSIGDVETAAALIAPRRLVVFNAPPSWGKALTPRYNAVQADTLTVQSDALTTDALLETLR
jgi:hypothetical protein